MNQKLKHLCLEEREKIEQLKEQKKSLIEIANELGRGKTTIRQELKRCEKCKYKALEAHRQYEESWEERRKKFIRQVKDEELLIIQKMMQQGKTRSAIRYALKWSFTKLESWFRSNNPEYRGGDMSSMNIRISNIEQQLDIIIDLMKNKGT